ncbi:chaplin [Streptomyces sp. WAC 01529]|uniref:chaplin n=1 Tax=Streptomyces sp. WAC 01529 TaxID=2203205 RepID=UPI000F6F4359|nr:chaplin [Streptomyces sp. WAC 01529]AZM57106.1 chaplin [Streptomyces sp. WAC 01529]
MRVRTLSVAVLLAATTVVGGASQALADDDGPTATGVSSNNPGVISGNNLQVPVELGANICGNTVDILAALNPALGNMCKAN